jgi:hypothetical protein
MTNYDQFGVSSRKQERIEKISKSEEILYVGLRVMLY